MANTVDKTKKIIAINIGINEMIDVEDNSLRGAAYSSACRFAEIAVGPSGVTEASLRRLVEAAMQGIESSDVVTNLR